MQQTIFYTIFISLLVLSISQNPPAPQPFLPFKPSPQPQVNVPETPQPQVRVPETSQPQVRVPENPQPQVTVPETPQPQVRVPESPQPQVRVPELSPKPVPQTVNGPQPFLPFKPSPQPQVNVPETPQPQVKVPESSVPQPFKAPESQAPQPNTPQPFLPFKPSPQPSNDNGQPEVALLPQSSDDSSADSRDQEMKITNTAPQIKTQIDQSITPEEATTTIPQASLKSDQLTVTITATLGNNGTQQTLTTICNTLRNALTQNCGRNFNDCTWTKSSKRQAGASYLGTTISPSPTGNVTPPPTDDSSSGAGLFITSMFSTILIIGIGLVL